MHLGKKAWEPGVQGEPLIVYSSLFWSQSTVVTPIDRQSPWGNGTAHLYSFIVAIKRYQNLHHLNVEQFAFRTISTAIEAEVRLYLLLETTVLYFTDICISYLLLKYIAF